jgi:hypothetical protein
MGERFTVNDEVSVGRGQPMGEGLRGMGNSLGALRIHRSLGS